MHARKNLSPLFTHIRIGFGKSLFPQPDDEGYACRCGKKHPEHRAADVECGKSAHCFPEGGDVPRCTPEHRRGGHGHQPVSARAHHQIPARALHPARTYATRKTKDGELPFFDILRAARVEEDKGLVRELAACRRGMDKATLAENVRIAACERADEDGDGDTAKAAARQVTTTDATAPALTRPSRVGARAPLPLSDIRMSPPRSR